MFTEEPFFFFCFFIANFPLFCQNKISLVLTAEPFLFYIGLHLLSTMLGIHTSLSLDMAQRYFLPSTSHP
jgi:hypothetical protein